MRYRYCPDPDNLRNVYCKADLVGARWQFYQEFPTIAAAEDATDRLNGSNKDELLARIKALGAANVKLMAENFKLSAEVYLLRGKTAQSPINRERILSKAAE